MDAGYLRPPSHFPTSTKEKQAKVARDMQKKVEEKAARMGAAAPQYDFLELIGKGNFGAVFKSRDRSDGRVVAVKVMDVDSSDYMDANSKDDAIRDFVKEVNILQQLKEKRAKNINLIFKAFALLGQLWIISEYCPGGSVRTLMRANPPPGGFEEKYIIPMARELAIALRYVHEAGIIHRDVKCANVLVRQDGQLQLCDFGVSAMLEGNVGKRSTIIGTPHWTAPEVASAMFSNQSSVQYGTEIDCWGFGCTIYEMAKGEPPFRNIQPNFVGDHAARQPPRLEGNMFSEQLKNFVTTCLQPNPKDRPSARRILEMSYVANTSMVYPTFTLMDLIDRFIRWEQQGGQRASILDDYGASLANALEPISADTDEWNFSMDETFGRPGQPGRSDMLPFGLSAQGSGPSANLGAGPGRRRHVDVFNRVQNERRAQRGAQALEGLFNPGAAPYEYKIRREDADLPLRSYSNNAASRTTLIDLDAAIPENEEEKTVVGRAVYPSNSNTIGSGDPRSALLKRTTQQWTFGTAETMSPDDDDEDMGNFRPFAAFSRPRPALNHAASEPIGTMGDYFRSINAGHSPPENRESLIDLDLAAEPYPPKTYGEQERPSTASSASGSNFTDITSGNPFDLEDSFNAGSNAPYRTGMGLSTDSLEFNEDGSNAQTARRTSFHTRGQSEPQKYNSALLAPSEVEPANRASRHVQTVSNDETQVRRGRDSTFGGVGSMKHLRGFSLSSSRSTDRDDAGELTVKQQKKAAGGASELPHGSTADSSRAQGKMRLPAIPTSVVSDEMVRELAGNDDFFNTYGAQSDDGAYPGPSGFSLDEIMATRDIGSLRDVSARIYDNIENLLNDLCRAL